MAKKKIVPKKLSLKAPMKRSKACLKSKKLVCKDEVSKGWMDKNRFKLK